MVAHVRALRAAQGDRSSTRSSTRRSRRKHRGRLILLYDERGNLKCETCFQCAAGLPDRDHRHGRRRHQEPLPRALGTRRAVRRAARGVGAAPLRPTGAGPSPSRRGCRSTSVRSRRSWSTSDYDPKPPADASSSGRRTHYGHLPVAALQHISHSTGAWYSEIYGIATSYPNLVFEPGRPTRDRHLPLRDLPLLGGGRVREAFEAALGTDVGGVSPDGAVRLGAARLQRREPRRATGDARRPAAAGRHAGRATDWPRSCAPSASKTARV